MQLHRLRIGEFRNLRDFEIKFVKSAIGGDGSVHDFRSQAIIGQNGSGKSNMIEALVTIFRDLDLNYLASFDYELDYEVRGYEVQIVAAEGNRPDVQVTTSKGATKSLESWELCDFREDPETGELERGHARLYLPSHIFTYYSGKSERLEQLFQDHVSQYMSFLNDAGQYSNSIPFIDPKSDLQDSEPFLSDAILRRLFYCLHPHSKLVLLATLVAPEQPLKDILKQLNIEEVDSVLFKLKKPYRLSGDMHKSDIEYGDKRFWYDRTNFAEEFLDKLWELAIAPIEDTEEKMIDFRGRNEEQELLYLYLKDRESLLELKDHIGDSYRFFRFAEGSYVADLLEDITIFVKHRTADGLVTFEKLSEGEQQLLTVLGLMRITHQDECLFLLDEPDTHLNPQWKLHYFEEIERLQQQNDDATIKGDSQIIVTTHDPLLIGGLRKEQVRVLENTPSGTKVTEPFEHPRGMGVAGLLKSDVFGLPSTLDWHTRNQIDQLNKLVALRQRGGITEDQENELEKLKSYLDFLGFSKASRDPMYQLFLERMHDLNGLPIDKLFTEQELKQQEQLSERIVRELLKVENTKDLSALAQELKIQLEAPE